MADNENSDSDDESPVRIDSRKHPLIAAKEWADRADENVQKWGNQDAAILLLALMEEVGEIADAMLESGRFPHIAYPPYATMANGADQDGRDLLDLVRDVGFASRDYLETYCEDDDGNPLPTDEMPDILSGIDPEAVREEVDDAAPLLLQLTWDLDRIGDEE